MLFKDRCIFSRSYVRNIHEIGVERRGGYSRAWKRNTSRLPQRLQNDLPAALPEAGARKVAKNKDTHFRTEDPWAHQLNFDGGGS